MRSLPLALLPFFALPGLAGGQDTVANDDVAEGCADSPLAIPVSVNDTTSVGVIDCTFLKVIEAPAHGTLEVVGCHFVYTPDPGYLGPDTFLYLTCNDQDPPSSDVARVTLDVCRTQAIDDLGATTLAGHPIAIGVLANDSATCGALDVASLQIVTPPTQGTVDVVGEDVVYTPEPGTTGLDSFVYRIGNDGWPACTDTATVHVEVLPDATSFCTGDATLALCPCSNAGRPDTGCDLAQGTGGVRLDLIEQETVPTNRATLRGSRYPVSSHPPALVIRSAALSRSGPVVFGDGLRCLALPVTRMGSAAGFGSGGVSFHTLGHGARAGLGTFYYQLWFRNAPAAFCDPTAAFNLSSGRSITW